MTSSQPPSQDGRPGPSWERLDQLSKSADKPGTPAGPRADLRPGPDRTQRPRQAEAEVVQLRAEVKSLTGKLESLTQKVEQLGATDSAQASKHASEQERRLREMENKAKDLREAMRSLAESVERPQSWEYSAEERICTLFHAQVMITQVRAYWSFDGASEMDDPLAAADRALHKMIAHPDSSADGTSDVIAAVVRIGAATLFVACIGAPIGAIVVDDAVVKEMVKTAIAAFVGQTAMELTELGIDRARSGTSHD